MSSELFREGGRERELAMLRYRLTHRPPVRPRRLSFGLLSAKEIEEMSVCEVIDTSLYYRGLQPAEASSIP